MYSRNRKIIILMSWLAVLMWVFLIYSFSAQPAVDSRSLSMDVTIFLNSALQRLFDGFKLSHHTVRKSAHFTVFSVLGILVMNALRRSGVNRFISVAVIFCMAIAASDEIHQIFVPGRGPSISDVLLNCIGMGFGILIYLKLMKHISLDWEKPIEKHL